MKFLSVMLPILLASGVLSVAGPAHADWVQSVDPVVVAPAPTNLQIQAQNPPTFTWSRHISAPASYTVEIKSASGAVSTYTSTRNWLLPSQILPLGSYSWRVRPTSTVEWSDYRNFTITAASAPFVVPENADLRARIAKTPRPRSLQGLPLYSAWSAPLKAERNAAMLKMRSEVDWVTVKPGAGVQDSEWTLQTGSVLTAANVAQTANIRALVSANGRQLEGASLLYRLTGEQKYLTEALYRGDMLAALDPYGPTSYVNQDQGTRVIALTLIKAIDTLGSAIDGTRRAAWLNVVRLRTNDIYADLAGSNGRMDQYPFDSHGGTNLGFLALIATLSLGEIKEADTWFDFSFRAYAAAFSAWSGPEGGFANGTAYAQYTADLALQVWQPLASASGIDMFSKPWSNGFVRYFMHFVPPGTPRHLFGDEAEVVPTFAVLKAFVSHYASPEAAWYFRALPVEMDALTLLQAPYPLPVSSVSTPLPPENARLYPSIGWAAMHSSMADNGRTSLYFKSSPYGSYNHSHGEQNSIVLVRNGVALLGQSGYSDYYGSPLASTWYRQTRAHNAITFDGGVGQAIDGYTPQGYTRTKAYGGKITAFSTTPQLDYVEGDATLAYSGALTQAVRKVWYLRGVNAAVVVDVLASATPRKFEWNFHSYVPMQTGENGKVIVTKDGQSVCLIPVSTGMPIAFEKRTGPPPKAGTVEDHGAFVNTVLQPKAEFVVVLDVGCSNPAPVFDPVARTLKVGAQTVTIPK
jgi:hypothetical protein